MTNSMTYQQQSPAPVVSIPAAADERCVVIPLDDIQQGRRIYHPDFPIYALLGALCLGILLGALGFMAAAGYLPVAGLGQWAAAGVAPAVFTAAGSGVALGALAGALTVLYRLPAANL